MGLLSGLGCDMNGKDMGTMGVGCGDYNNDGLLDFYATAYQDQLPSLYLNTGEGLFEDVSLLTGAGANHTVTWGSDFADFDNDGDRDLFVALGHLQDNIALWDQRSTYLAENKLYQSHYGTRLHFGLGPRKQIGRIEVRWIGGSTDIFADVPVDRLIVLKEGSKQLRQCSH